MINIHQSERLGTQLKSNIGLLLHYVVKMLLSFVIRLVWNHSLLL